MRSGTACGGFLPADPPRGAWWADHRKVIDGIFFRTRAGQGTREAKLTDPDANEVRVGSRAGIGNRQPLPDKQQDRRAIGVPLTTVKGGTWRPLPSTQVGRSDRVTARFVQIPKLTVRVRFPHPLQSGNRSSAPIPGTALK
jgi:hypothetical protein